MLAAWEYPERTSARVVDVLFVMEPSGSDVWAIPSGSEVATVQAYLDERAPSTMTVDVIAPVDDGRSLAIAVTPNTAAVQAAVVERVKAMFLRVAEPGGTITLSQISAAVSEAVGETDHSITSPASDLSSTGDDLLSYDGIMFT